jgi:hypothetical protein
MIWTLKLDVTEALGVPETNPARESVNPGGNAPEITLHDWKSDALVAASCKLYAVPTAPFGNVVVVMFAAV